jgi:4-hydroxy-tetrahydrodipicolinate synthase
MYDTGIDGVIINSGLLATEVESEDVAKKNMEKILNATDNIQFGIYECPIPYKRIISINLMKWMADTGRFEFLKSTSCNLNEIKSKLAVTNGSNVKINNANIPTALSSLKAGAHGIASIASNFYPELISYLANYKEKELANVEKLNTWLTIVDILIHQVYPMSAKYFLHKRGMNIQLNTRIPMGSFAYQDYVKFDELLNGFYLISEELEIDVYRF